MTTIFGTARDYGTTFGRSGACHGESFGIELQLPEEAIGMGRIMQPFFYAPATCQGREVPFPVACSFDMRGEITLRKTGRKGFGPAPR